MQEHTMTHSLINFNLNGINKELFVRHSDTLLFTLRNQLGLMGAKPGCENGDCGSCTILMNGIPINACHILSVEVSGSNIITIEGLMDTTIQRAFIKHWAIQCGYCTPGFILNSYALKMNHPHADDAMIDEWLDSNLCRCTGYQEIKDAVKSVLNARQIDG